MPNRVEKKNLNKREKKEKKKKSKKEKKLINRILTFT